MSINENLVPSDPSENPFIGGDDNDRLVGSLFADLMSGGLGVDTMFGLNGDDEIAGDKGDDEMFGGDGDDRLVWNNGDGSDLMEGGEGDDRTQVNFNTDLVNEDLANDDTARITTEGASASFARTELNGQTEAGLFELTINEVETLEVNFGAGDDTADLDGDLSDQVDIELDGGKDVDTLDLSDLEDGARVVLDAAGGDAQNGFVDLPGGRRVEVRDFENVLGTDFGDNIRANREDNLLAGGLGEDTMRGFRGDDTIIGGKGNDRMIGGKGDDLLVWNNGDGSDLMIGGRDDDTVQVNFNTDLVNEDLQNDDTARIQTAGTNIAFARTELNGQNEAGLFALDIRFTETLEVNFGGGDDTAALVGALSAASTVELDGGDGEDLIDLSELNRGAMVDFGANEIKTARAGVATFTGFENIIGSDFADEIKGDAGVNVIEGGDGDDTLIGARGDDEVFGGDGDDLLVWNNGDGSDLLTGGEGDDTVQVNFQQNSDLSNLDLQNDDVVEITSDGDTVFLDRVAVNGQSVNGLFRLEIEGQNAEDGSETLEVNFGGGDDVASVQDFADLEIQISLDGGDGVDTLDFAQLDLGGEESDSGVVFDVASGVVSEVADFESDMTAVNFENVVGSSGDDVITGDDGANVLEGGEGRDRLTGGGGADTFVFNEGDGTDVITDFSIADDKFELDTVPAPFLVFDQVERDGEGTDAGLVGVNQEANVFVLQGGFQNAGQAADALAEALFEGGGPGYFVYFNENQERARLVEVDDLGDVDSDIAVLANLGDGGVGAEAADAVRAAQADFTADNFVFAHNFFDVELA